MASTIQKQLSTKKDRRSMHSSSDENVLMKQIRDTHNPESRFLDVKPVFLISEYVLRQSTTPRAIDAVTKEQNGHIATLADSTSFEDFDGLIEDLLCHFIDKISCEIFCKCSGNDLHGSTMSLFKMLSNNPWETKVVLCLAAFSAIYGDLWLVAKLCTTNPLAKSVAILKQVSYITDNTKELRNHLDGLEKLIEAIINITKHIVEFSELPLEYLSLDIAPISVAKSYIPVAAYWTVRSIVACAWHVSTLPGMKQEYISSTTEVWELSSLAHKLLSIYEHLGNETENCRQYIKGRKYEEEFQALSHLITSSHMDNMKILRALFCPRDDQHPFVIGSNKTRIDIEVLRRKHVLLLISDLSLSDEEVMILSQLYAMKNQFQACEYEVVWVPIVDSSSGWTEAHQVKFSNLKATMPWYSVHDPRVLEPHVIRLIKQQWNFHKKMILVTLDPLGKVTSKSALHMVWIWGNLACPFSDEKEASLWNAETWRLELLVDGIDPDMPKRVEDGRYTCFYGGEDMGWIREFTTTTKQIAEALGIILELIYVGKGNINKERLRKITTTISEEKLSDVWLDPISTWYFWSRLESMRCSKTKQHKTVDNDQIMREVMTLLSYDGSHQGWVEIWRGTTEMARADGKLALLTLKQFEAWKAEAEADFMNAFMQESKNRHTAEHCTSLILPGTDKEIPEKVTCTECNRLMEKFYLFRCCTD